MNKLVVNSTEGLISFLTVFENMIERYIANNN